MPPLRPSHVAPTPPQRCRKAASTPSPHRSNAAATPPQRRPHAAATPTSRCPRPPPRCTQLSRRSHAGCTPPLLHAASTPLAHRRNAASRRPRVAASSPHTAVAPPSRRCTLQRSPHAAARSPRAAACSPHTAVAPPSRRCTPLLTVPTPHPTGPPPPSLRLTQHPHAAATPPSRRSHAAAPRPHAAVAPLHTLTPPQRHTCAGPSCRCQRFWKGEAGGVVRARVGPGGDGVAGRAGPGRAGCGGAAGRVAARGMRVGSVTSLGPNFGPFWHR